MDVILIPFLLLLKSIISLTVIIVLIDVIMGWLIAADILNINNRFIFSIVDTCSRISNFLLNPIRERLPINWGAVDISPVILLLLLTFLENIITRLILKIQ